MPDETQSQTQTADDRHEDGRAELLETPPDAKMLTTLGMAKKTPGWCACGEHRDEDDHQ